MSERFHHKPLISEALLAHLPSLEGWKGIEPRLKIVHYWNIAGRSDLDEGMGYLGFGIEADIQTRLLRRVAEAELDQAAPVFFGLPGKPGYAKKAESRFFDYFVDAVEFAQADPECDLTRPLMLWVHAITVSNAPFLPFSSITGTSGCVAAPLRFLCRY